MESDSDTPGTFHRDIQYVADPNPTGLGVPTATNENTRFFEEGKQVVAPDGLQPSHEDKQVYTDEDGGKHLPSEVSHPLVTPPRFKSWKKWRVVIILVALIVLTAIVVPVAVVLSRNQDDSNPDSTKSTSSNPPANETSQPLDSVLKGTRLTTMDPLTGGDIYLFYQWGDNGLRYISQSPQRQWQGPVDIGVKDAKAGTPLASISTGGTNVSVFWWLFYVDTANIIQNVHLGNGVEGWAKGNVGDKGYKVPNGTNIAFTVSNGRKYNKTINGLDGGMSLYAAGLDNLIHEYVYDDQDKSWNDSYTFPDTDGQYGASTFSEKSSAFLFTASSNQVLELWERDYSIQPNKLYSGWRLGPSSHADLLQDASMSGKLYLAFQSSDGMIQGSNFTSFDNPGETRWGTIYNISDQPAIKGSALSFWFFYSFDKANPNIMMQAFYQTNENEIEEAIRTWGPDNATVPGTWIYNTVPV